MRFAKTNGRGRAVVAVTVVVAGMLAGCASTPKPPPADPLAADLSAAPRGAASRAADPAYNPQLDMDFVVAERASVAPEAPRAPTQALRMDGSARSSKQKVKPAAP